MKATCQNGWFHIKVVLCTTSVAGVLTPSFSGIEPWRFWFYLHRFRDSSLRFMLPHRYNRGERNLVCGAQSNGNGDLEMWKYFSPDQSGGQTDRQTDRQTDQ